MIGMFALAPLSGRLADRFGSRTAIHLGVGLLLLASAIAFATAFAAGHVAGMSVAMFLLGYGWNLVFVGGSAMLSRALPGDQRTQGAVDAVVWSTSAFASLGAGVLFGLGGYPLVTVVGAVLALLPLTVLIRRPAPAAPEPHPLPASAGPRSPRR
jgi:MFS family permease